MAAFPQLVKEIFWATARYRVQYCQREWDDAIRSCENEDKWQMMRCSCVMAVPCGVWVMMWVRGVWDVAWCGRSARPALRRAGAHQAQRAACS